VSAKGDSADGSGFAGAGEGRSRSGTALLVSQNLKMISGLVATMDSVASPHDVAVHMQHLTDCVHKMHQLVQRARSKAKGLSTKLLPLPALPYAFFFLLLRTVCFPCLAGLSASFLPLPALPLAFCFLSLRTFRLLSRT